MGFTPFGFSAVSVAPHRCSRDQYCSDSISVVDCVSISHALSKVKTSGDFVISGTCVRSAIPALPSRMWQ